VSLELPMIRRVVCENNKEGKSVIVEDGPPKHERRDPNNPGRRVCNLWATFGSPAPIGDPDRSTEIKGILPPPGGTVVKIIDMPPEPKATAERDRTVAHAFSAQAQEPGLRRRPETGHPGMHETDTVDYAVVLKGEIYAMVDGGETLLKEGDILIHRATNHAWSNRSSETCRVLFVLVAATPK
jgi:hypothetical protein